MTLKHSKLAQEQRTVRYPLFQSVGCLVSNLLICFITEHGILVFTKHLLCTGKNGVCVCVCLLLSLHEKHLAYLHSACLACPWGAHHQESDDKRVGGVCSTCCRLILLVVDWLRKRAKESMLLLQVILTSAHAIETETVVKGTLLKTCTVILATNKSWH